MDKKEQALSQELFHHWFNRFDPAIYDATRTFSLSDWYFALWRRRLAWDAMQYRSWDEVDLVKQLVFETPLLTAGPLPMDKRRSTVGDLCALTAWGMKEVIEGDPQVAAACEAELSGSGAAPFECEYAPESDEWWEELVRSARAKQPNDLVWDSYHDVMHRVGLRDNFAFAEVDMSATDEQIIADFKKWLVKLRASASFQHSPFRSFTAKELARWSSNRVLAYIDLITLAKALNVPLAHHTAGEKLFAERDLNPAEKIRKTVAPLAEHLLSYPTLEALRSSAGAERKDLDL